MQNLDGNIHSGDARAEQQALRRLLAITLASRDAGMGGNSTQSSRGGLAPAQIDDAIRQAAQAHAACAAALTVQARCAHVAQSIQAKSSAASAGDGDLGGYDAALLGKGVIARCGYKAG
ncbi:MAG TPA: hypothetical protein VLH85_04620 [Levilinea sp.]|nr:hypothetical protein [Levilinea sp.]